MENVPRKKIEILGPGCNRCKETYRVVQQVVEESGLECEVVKGGLVPADDGAGDHGDAGNRHRWQGRPHWPRAEGRRGASAAGRGVARWRAGATRHLGEAPLLKGGVPRIDCGPARLSGRLLGLGSLERVDACLETVDYHPCVAGGGVGRNERFGLGGLAGDWGAES